MCPADEAQKSAEENLSRVFLGKMSVSLWIVVRLSVMIVLRVSQGIVGRVSQKPMTRCIFPLLNVKIRLAPRICLINWGLLPCLNWDMVNMLQGCKTPGCRGNLVPVSVDSQGLGGSFSISCYCDGCSLKGAVFETSMKHEGEFWSTNAVKMCVQVAFIIAGSTHAVYYKTLKHALGIEAVGEHAFMVVICFLL